jgi:hypothetical protein
MLDHLRFAHPGLLSPEKLSSREDVLHSPSVVPAAPGVYARHFKHAPANVPTDGCLYPLFYALGAGDNGEPLRFEYEGIENASISMRCLSLGA